MAQSPSLLEAVRNKIRVSITAFAPKNLTLNG